MYEPVSPALTTVKYAYQKHNVNNVKLIHSYSMEIVYKPAQKDTISRVEFVSLVFNPVDNVQEDQFINAPNVTKDSTSSIIDAYRNVLMDTSVICKLCLVINVPPFVRHVQISLTVTPV